MKFFTGFKTGAISELKTARLLIRPSRPSDFPAWRDVRDRNRDLLIPFEPRWPDNALEKDFFHRRCLRLDEDRAGDRGYAFLIFAKDHGDLLGGININNVVRGAAQFASLGYWLDKAAQSRGYMTEAATEIIRHSFEDLNLQRLNAATLPHNLKSIAMLKRNGFVEEGMAKAYLQIDGARRDHILFGLNKTFLGASAAD